MPNAILLSQGDEVVTGQITDTNAAWLATELTGLGFDVLQHVTVGDRLIAIQEQVYRTSLEADLIISTGGLGPTEDDLTAEAVANAFNTPLSLDETALEHILEHYTRSNRVMPKVNRKQAFLPQDARRIDNHWGTAPGFAVKANHCLLIFLPGVPREMKPMFHQKVRPLLDVQFQLTPGRLVTFRTTGVGESTLQERIGTFSHKDIILSYRTKLPENHIKLRVPASVPDIELDRVCSILIEQIGSPLFAIEGWTDTPEGSLQEVVGTALLKRSETVAVAESCTGGRISSMFTGIPGSSQWFKEGAVTYSNASKTRQLGVLASSLDEHGAVSETVCKEMAQGIRGVSGATYGLATTGIAGPGGETDNKKVGTVYIGLQTPTDFFSRRLQLPGDRHRIQQLAAAACIDMLRRHLQHFHLEN